ncbi:hypothetical protein [Roseobacter phage RDJL6]|nr:hypothetical protein [Roseobacter phage RDJL6]
MSSQSFMLKGPDTDGGSRSHARLDRYLGLLGVTTMEQFAVSLGRYYGAGHYEAALASAASIDLLVRTPSASIMQAISLAGVVNSGADSLLQVYENPETSASGTALNALQVNRVSPNVSSTLGFRAPTITNLGTLIFQLFTPGGKGGNAIGGTSSDFQRLHCAPSTDYLIRTTNLGTASKPVSVSLNWIEIPK